MENYKNGDILGGRYEILEKIGEGGMAVVYKAMDTLLSRYVAVKILRSQYASDQEFVERFRREARSAAGLSHPNIVGIFDVGQDNGAYYIVMEFVRGKNLKEIIRSNAPLPFEKAIRILQEICEALKHAHDNGIVHRDIKPHNILITNDDRVKVTDFGIARAADNVNLTQTGIILGSVHYFSPEQARGGFVGRASDIYSAGIILYEMVTASVPFCGESPIATALMHVQEDIPEPRTVNDKIDPILQRIICKALEKKPGERYQTADELMYELSQYRHMIYSYDAEDDTIPLEALSEEQINGFNKVRDENNKSETKKEDNQLQRENKNNNDNGQDTVLNREKNKDITREIDNMAPVENKATFARNFLIIVITLFFIVLLGIWILQMVPRILYVPEVEVPNVVGKSLTEARGVVENQKLKLVVFQEVHDTEVPQGHVISQDPSGRQIRKEGREVQVVLSLGPKIVTAPNIIGEVYRNAEIVVSDKGLNMGDIAYSYSNDVVQGRIIEQVPEPGQEVYSDTEIAIVISRGPVPSEVKIPNFLGQELSEVKRELEDLELELGLIHEDYDGLIPKGHIISQKPEPESITLRGSQMEFVLSLGDYEEQAPSQGRIRIADVRVHIPSGPDRQLLEIKVVDDYGQRTVYSNIHSPREYVERRVEGYGSARVEIYIDGILWEDMDI